MLALLMTGTLLVACKKEEETAPETEATESVEGQSTLSQVTVEGLANYVLVYSADATDEVASAAGTIVAAFATKFDVTLKTRTDDYIDRTGELVIEEYEILLGDTNREESKEFLSGLKYKDKGYALVGKKICIGAHDFYTTASIASEFASFIRKSDKKADVFFDESMNTVKPAEYNYGAMTVDGANISEYRIVYPDGSGLEQVMATKVRRAIAESCGVLVEIVSDTAEAADREILIGKTNREIGLSVLDGAQYDKGFVGMYGNKILICGGGSVGISNATNAFIGLFAGGEKADTFEIDVAKLGQQS